MMDTTTNTPHDTWATRFESVGLDELDATASLQTRVDRKYVATCADLEAVMDRVAGHGRVLDLDGRRQFSYRSTYYDTPDRSSYLDTARKRPRRWKARTRTYLDSDVHFIEVKTRSRRKRTVKTRQSASARDHDHLSAASRRFVATTLSERLDITLDAARQIVDELQPTLTTEYQRATLLVPSDASRATVDTGFTVSLPDGTSRRFGDQVIIETKTSGRASLVDRSLWDMGIRPVSISKFGAGLAILEPSLPAAKWNRVLRHNFDWTPARAA